MAKKVVRYKLVRHKWPDEIEAERKARLKKASIVALGVLIFFSGMLTTKYLGKNELMKDETFSKLSQIYAVMKDQFYFSKDKENFNDALINGAISGMVSAGEDKHTMYLDAKQSSDFTSSMEGSFVGIGIQYYAQDEDTFLVSKVLNNSPAEDAGLLKGDQIYRINDTICEDMTVDKVKELMIGESGTKVEVEIVRDQKHMVMDIKRRKVNDSVYSEVDGSTGILEISSFSETGGPDTGVQLADIKDAGCKNLILDLRDNGGGYLVAAQQIASYLLGEDQLIFKEVYKDGEVEEVRTLKDNEHYTFDKIIILVNGNTASAAEVLTAALKEDLDNITIVGETTYGKGTVQIPLSFSDGSMLKYTTAEWVTPSGKKINGVGITPDVEVSLDSVYTTGAPQLKEDESYKVDTVSEAAKVVQTYLNFLGYATDRSDEYFSYAGERALRQYQEDKGLEVNGVIDRKVINALLSSVNSEWNTNENEYDVQMKKAKELIEK